MSTSLQAAARAWLVTKLGAMCGNRIREAPDPRDVRPFVVYQDLSRVPTPTQAAASNGCPAARVRVSIYGDTSPAVEAIAAALRDAVNAEPDWASWSGLLVSGLEWEDLGANNDLQPADASERPYFGRLIDLVLNYVEG